MLLGKFGAAYVDDILDSASKIVDFESVDVSYTSKNSADDSRTALITAELRNHEDRDKLDRFLFTSSERDGLMLIRGLGFD